MARPFKILQKNLQNCQKQLKNRVKNPESSLKKPKWVRKVNLIRSHKNQASSSSTPSSPSPKIVHQRRNVSFNDLKEPLTSKCQRAVSLIEMDGIDLDKIIPNIELIRRDVGLVKPDLNQVTPDIKQVRRDSNLVKPSLNQVESDIKQVRRDPGLVKPDLDPTVPDLVECNSLRKNRCPRSITNRVRKLVELFEKNTVTSSKLKYHLKSLHDKKDSRDKIHGAPAKIDIPSNNSYIGEKQAKSHENSFNHTIFSCLEMFNEEVLNESLKCIEESFYSCSSNSYIFLPPRSNESLKRERAPKVIGAFLKKSIEIDSITVDWLPESINLLRKSSFKKLDSLTKGEKIDEKNKYLQSQVDSKKLLYSESRDKSPPLSTPVKLMEEISITNRSLNKLNNSNGCTEEVSQVSTFMSHNSSIKDSHVMKTHNPSANNSFNSKKNLMLHKIPQSDVRVESCSNSLNRQKLYINSENTEKSMRDTNEEIKTRSISFRDNKINQVKLQKIFESTSSSNNLSNVPKSSSSNSDSSSSKSSDGDICISCQNVLHCDLPKIKLRKRTTSNVHDMCQSLGRRVASMNTMATKCEEPVTQKPQIATVEPLTSIIIKRELLTEEYFKTIQGLTVPSINYEEYSPNKKSWISVVKNSIKYHSLFT